MRFRLLLILISFLLVANSALALVCTSTPTVPCNVSSSLTLAPGSYNFTARAFNTSSLTFNTSGVTLDCNDSHLFANYTDLASQAVALWFNVGVNNVVIKNCNISHYGFAISTADDSHRNITIMNNRFFNLSSGIVLTLNYSEIKGNTIFNITQSGINLGTGAYLTENDNLTNNTIYSYSSSGILTNRLDRTNISNNILHSSIKTGSSTIGIYITINSSDNWIHHNLISDDLIGIQTLTNNRTNYIVNNTIRDFNCTSGGTCASGGSLAAGIAPSWNSVLLYNNISNITTNSFSSQGSFGTGIFMIALHNVTVTGNSITKTEVGIWSAGDSVTINNSMDHTFTNNTIANGTDPASTAILGASTDLAFAALQNCTFTGNTFNNYATVFSCDNTCNGSLFYQNNFINITVDAVNNNGSNDFNKSDQGNFWSDIINKSLNLSDTNFDGLYGSGTNYPYNKSNSANMSSFTAADFHPYLYQNGWLRAPNVTILTAGWQITNFTVNVTAKDAITQNVTYQLLNASSGTNVTGWLLMSNITGYAWNASFRFPGLADGNYTVLINATTSVEASNASVNGSLGVDTAVPVASSFQVTNLSTSSINFSMSATDQTSGVSICNYTGAGSGNFSNISTTYNTTLTGLNSSRTYTLNITCLDVAGNVQSNTTTFTIASPSSATSGNGGGGGTADIRLSPCSENWLCGSWSSCSSSGTKTRTCDDLNSCGTSSSKPVVRESCTPSSTSPQELSVASTSEGSAVEQQLPSPVSPQDNGATVGQVAYAGGYNWAWNGRQWVRDDDPSYAALLGVSPQGKTGVFAVWMIGVAAVLVGIGSFFFVHKLKS
ncbi:right-handed parallel beta-helix repeat-containing protein [Candidatus Woesearchaeota archaeon]|nr:right-handed parallel beta-helix repeat-containing protein [Candidatus Woesearchaeota archaeon]